MSRDLTNVANLFLSCECQRNLARSRGFRFVVTGVVLLALTLAVLALRFHRLNEIPPGLNFDEAAHGVDALRVLQGRHAAFFPGNYGREGLIVYAITLTTSLLGRSVLAVRLPTALASAGTVFVVFWLGQILFGRDEEGQATPWRGLFVGSIGAGLLAVSVDHTVQGRVAYRAAFLPLFLCLCLALLWEGWRQRSWWRVVLGGVCAGLMPYTYISARFTPFLFLLFGLSFLLPFGSVARARVRAAVPWIAIFVVVTGLVAAPILVHFALHPDHFFMRSNQLSIFQPEDSLGASLGALLDNVWKHRLAFDFREDPNTPGQPLLRPWEAFFFWLGLGLAVWRWQLRPAYRLLLLWLGVMLLPSMLAATTGPHILRMMGAAPAIYLLAGVGMWEVFRFVMDRFPLRAVSLGAISVGAVVSSLILVQGVLTYRVYFQKWEVEPELSWWHGVPWIELTQVLNAQLFEPNMVYLIPSSHHTYSFEYLYQGALPADLFHPAAPDFPQEVSTTLEAIEGVSIVKVVEWKAHVNWMGDDLGRFAFLLSKYGRYLGAEEYDDFQLHTYTDISLEHPWTFYGYLEPLTVDYDGGIALQGLALGQGEEQMSSRQVLELGRDRPLWMALRWKITPGLDIDYAISLRLYDAAGERAYQEDAVLWNPGHRPTSNWPLEEPVDTTSLLSLPAELSAGEYELRMVVYDFATLKPAVEIGVWEAETTLARLRLAETQ